MELTQIIASETTPEREELILVRRGSVYTLRVDGMELMTSRAHRSEEELARLACSARPPAGAPRVLIGGLGFGYTLRAALDALPRRATVCVCELFGQLIEWNRTALRDLAGNPLDDPRVEIVRADVRTRLGKGAVFDVIILDVDNGPWAFTVRSNEELYSTSGLEAIARCLRPKGVLAIWSSRESRTFEKRLERNGFEVRCESVPAGQRQHHTVFVAIKGSGERGNGLG